MQKIPSGPFARPRSNVTENNTNQNNYNSNHNILTPQNNLPTNGQSLYHHEYLHNHRAATTNNSYNNHRPPPIAVGGPCSMGFDQVDNSNAGMNARPVMALTPNSLGDMQIPSETSETSSSSEPSSSSEEWESGECCDQIISSTTSNVIEVRSSDNFDKMQAINNQLDLKCGVKFSKNSSSNCTVVVKSDDHDDDREVIHLDYSEKKPQERHSLQIKHYSDDNYYLGSSVSLVVASAIPISRSKQPSSDSANQSQSLTSTNASPPITKILSQRKKFKAKSGIPHASVTATTGKKIRWLANMKSDPDFRETLNKNVHFRATTGLSPVRTSNDSLNSDYYSSICDKQLSFGSPAKSPSDFIRLSKVQELKSHEECPDIVVATKKKVTPEFCTPPPPNTPTTPGGRTSPSLCSQNPPYDDDSRKSPAKTENSFRQRFFNFTRRDHDTSPLPQTPNAIPIIKITNDADIPLPSNTDTDKTETKPSSNSKFSFRDLRHEIQSAIKMHHQHTHATIPSSTSESNDNNNKGNSDKKSKKIG